MKTTLSVTRRQVLAGGVATATVATLAACGSSKTTDVKTAKPSAGAASSAPAADGDVVTLKYWHRLPDGEGMTKVADIVAKWNKDNPKIQVEATKFDGKADESYAKIAQAVKTGEAPDLAQVNLGHVASQFIAGNLEDVAKEIKEGGYAAHFAAGLMSQCTLGEVVVGLPQDSGPLVYVYDKAAFDALGITVPTTWDELKTAAATAKEQGKYIMTWQGDEAGNMLPGLAAAAGATWFSVENGDSWKVNIDSPETAKVSTILQGLIDEGLCLLLSDGRWGKEWGAKLTDGTIIGTVAAGWEPAFMLGDLKKEETQWQVAKLPKFGDQDMTGPDGGSAVCVIKGCKHKAEAVKFLDWFNTQVPDLVSQGLVVATTTGKPATPDAMKKLWGGQDVYSFLAEANATMNPNFPFSPTWASTSDKMKEAGGQVTTGAGKVADVFTAGQTEAVDSLKKAGLKVVE
ncbi:ABC transporter substrate-binding protein [Actinomyces trachealis]|uniref:ABC transporter substrate-binding protein n=1 Tax=Actinomyces trachealis TaxID=2763540 RepID=UPI001892B1CC|nr:extracellular solute-binding protein [Actinomyces trachealis]